MEEKDIKTYECINKEELSVQNQRNLLKTQLKIFGIWCIVGFLFTMIYGLLTLMYQNSDGLEIIKGVVTTFLYIICMPIGAIIVFSPAILVLYFLFKKYKDAISRIFFVSLLIPFTNWVYFYIEYFCFGNSIPTLTMVVGAITIGQVLPFAFLVSLFIPKSLMPYKKNVIVTIILTWLYGAGMIALSLGLLDPIESFIENSKLKRYEPVIETIENYKSQQGIYPDTVDDNVKIFRTFEYEPKNDNKDFILKVGNHWTKSYYYCTNSEYDHCHEGWLWSGRHTEIGKWIKADYSD